MFALDSSSWNSSFRQIECPLHITPFYKKEYSDVASNQLCTADASSVFFCSKK